MRIISVQVTNFGSIKKAHIDFQNRGLQLVQGPTGSGKSTLCDIIPWILFGKTAKNGSVDEVRSWGAMDETSGTAYLTLPKANVLITRTRHPNDLFFAYQGNTRDFIRGKDLNDTQRMINELLGVTPDTFLAASYFHEFSKIAQFFTADAKTRKFITEQIVDLTFAKNLQAKLSDSKKELKKEYGKYLAEFTQVSAKLESLEERHDKEYDRFAAWGVQKLTKLKEYEQKNKNFIENKKNEISRAEFNIRSLQAKKFDELALESQLKQVLTEKQALGEELCTECGSKKSSNELEELNRIESQILKRKHQNALIDAQLDSHTHQLVKIRASQNTYQEQIDELAKAQNPHKKALEEYHESLYKFKNLQKELEAKVKQKAELLEDLEQLSDVTDSHRAFTIKNTLLEIENTTNELLNKHFDAELTASFAIEDSDKVIVTITKDNNDCSYTQLSKGQRCLLKLCFGWAVMKIIASHSNVTFSTLSFDESLDGLDDNFKIKAYKFLSTLALDYENIFVVDHNEALKNLFENRIDVQLINGETVISEQA